MTVDTTSYKKSKGVTMKATMRATYSNGALMPVFTLDLEEGTEVTLTVESEPSLSFEERIEITKSSAGSWKGLHDPEEFKRTIYEARKTGSA